MLSSGSLSLEAPLSRPHTNASLNNEEAITSAAAAREVTQKTGDVSATCVTCSSIRRPCSGHLMEVRCRAHPLPPGGSVEQQQPYFTGFFVLGTCWLSLFTLLRCRKVIKFGTVTISDHQEVLLHPQRPFFCLVGQKWLELSPGGLDLGNPDLQDQSLLQLIPSDNTHFGGE